MSYGSRCSLNDSPSTTGGQKMICLVITLFLTLIQKCPLSSVNRHRIHFHTFPHTGGHFHLAILMFLYHKCLLQFPMASTQAVYESLLLTFPWCRLWTASSYPKAWANLTEKDTMSCLLVVLLTIQKYDQKKLSSQADRIKPLFSKSLWPSSQMGKVSVLSIAWVERKRTHHQVWELIILLTS